MIWLRSGTVKCTGTASSIWRGGHSIARREEGSGSGRDGTGWSRTIRFTWVDGIIIKAVVVVAYMRSWSSYFQVSAVASDQHFSPGPPVVQCDERRCQGGGRWVRSQKAEVIFCFCLFKYRDDIVLWILGIVTSLAISNGPVGISYMFSYTCPGGNYCIDMKVIVAMYTTRDSGPWEIAIWMKKVLLPIMLFTLFSLLFAVKKRNT